MLWMLMFVAFPKTRSSDWNWEEREGGLPLSGFAYAALAIFAATWVVALLAAGLHYESITDHAVWLVGAGFVTVFGAIIYDHKSSGRF